MIYCYELTILPQQTQELVAVDSDRRIGAPCGLSRQEVLAWSTNGLPPLDENGLCQNLFRNAAGNIVPCGCPMNEHPSLLTGECTISVFTAILLCSHSIN